MPNPIRGYLSPGWRGFVPRNHENKPYLRWLTDRASLTKKLMDYGKFSIVVLQQCLLRPTKDEAFVLGINPQHLARVREVVLHCNNVPLVFARVIFPLSPLCSIKRHWNSLGSKSIGGLLFASARVVRDRFSYCHLKKQHFLYTRATPTIGSSHWARRSVFHISRQQLLVIEVFSARVLSLEAL